MYVSTLFEQHTGAGCCRRRQRSVPCMLILFVYKKSRPKACLMIFCIKKEQALPAPFWLPKSRPRILFGPDVYNILICCRIDAARALRGISQKVLPRSSRARLPASQGLAALSSSPFLCIIIAHSSFFSKNLLTKCL